MRFEGKTIWVTGGRSGIGKAIAASFMNEGADAYLSSRDPEGLRATASELGANAFAVPCDVTDAAEVQAAYRKIMDRTGHIDILVNNAGTTVFQPFTETDIDAFDDLMTTNLRGPFLTTKAVLPSMLERGEGHIVMINSMAARQVFPNSSVYGATKAGLRMMADCLRSEVRSSGIRVLNVYPGATDTAIWPDRVREKHAERMMTADDVAAAVCDACAASSRTTIEELVLQPIGGAL
ncbi:SDR family oxidoreductase [bacterium]|nr:SDR family oxidoreductase [bacterium]